MPPLAAVKPSQSPSAKWTPRLHCSHSAHLLQPRPSSSPSSSPLSQKMGNENPFCPTNQIILYCHFPSPLRLSLSFLPPHAITLLYLPFFFRLPGFSTFSLPPKKKTSDAMKDVSQGLGIFPFPYCNPIRSYGNARLKIHCLSGPSHSNFNISHLHGSQSHV